MPYAQSAPPNVPKPQLGSYSNGRDLFDAKYTSLLIWCFFVDLENKILGIKMNERKNCFSMLRLENSSSLIVHPPPRPSLGKYIYIYIYLCLAEVEAGDGSYDTASGDIFFLSRTKWLAVRTKLLAVRTIPPNHSK
jgi:hypothetical protein